MTATAATRYRIVEHGNPGWIVVRRFNEHGCRMVEVHNPDLAHMTYDNGPAIVRCPESHLIPAAGTPRAVVDAPTEGAVYATVGASSPPAAGIPVPAAGGTSSTTEAGGISTVAAHVDPLAGSGVGPGPASTPSARATDPAPAHDAASVAAATSTFDAWLVLAAHIAHGSDGCTGDELAKTCGRKYESVGPRRPALERAGAITPTGERRKGKGVYVATEAGRAAWLRLAPVSIVPSVEACLTSTAVTALHRLKDVAA